MHEVRLIERARMKAAWEKVIQPNIKEPNSVIQFRDYLEALERDEWAFREQVRSFILNCCCTSIEIKQSKL